MSERGQHATWVHQTNLPVKDRLFALQTIRLMGPSVEQWVWVSDFYGFGFADLSPRIAQTFLELSARHYPERLGAFLVRPFLCFEPAAFTRRPLMLHRCDIGYEECPECDSRWWNALEDLLGKVPT